MQIKVINLAHRTDRWEEIQRQLHAFGIQEYERFEAYTGGYMGFNKSMHFALEGEGNILILEDDCVFDGHFCDLETAISELPEDFDMLYLGANVKSRQKNHSAHLYHLTDAWTSHAIYYSAKGRKFCFDNFREGEQTIYDEWVNTVGQQSGLKRFIVKPFLATQADGFSDIWGANTVYGIKGSESNLK